MHFLYDFKSHEKKKKIKHFLNEKKCVFGSVRSVNIPVLRGLLRISFPCCGLFIFSKNEYRPLRSLITVIRRRTCALKRNVRPLYVSTTRNVRIRQYNTSQYNTRNVRKIVCTWTGQCGWVSGNGNKRIKNREYLQKESV
jgi:hypothetical protein